MGDEADTRRRELDKAAAVLQQRFEARMEERAKRDSKLREEWLGRTFNLVMRDEIFGNEALPMRLEAYDPVKCVVKMRPLWGHEPSLVPWSTDQFWSLLKTGQIVPM